MKSRRVTLTVEVDSNEGIADLKRGLKAYLEIADGQVTTKVIQIQADVFKSYFKKRSNQEGGPC